jgi:hypothetical protein
MAQRGLTSERFIDLPDGRRISHERRRTARPTVQSNTSVDDRVKVKR